MPVREVSLYRNALVSEVFPYIQWPLEGTRAPGLPLRLAASVLPFLWHRNAISDSCFYTCHSLSGDDFKEGLNACRVKYPPSFADSSKSLSPTDRCLKCMCVDGVQEIPWPDSPFAQGRCALSAFAGAAAFVGEIPINLTNRSGISVSLCYTPGPATAAV